ncbi:DUF7151 family protein [Flagellimonas crocea]|uniref:DUF7151 family protein n=1 Tax=Flagellimonas crocea TaxID=3067311 RepID=UPI00296EF1F9|nr:hypothetical protein [Muricauda sp. DH64]
MKKILSLNLSALFLILISVISCSPEDGTNGLDGRDGIDGLDGQNGSNGLNSLISTTMEPAGENCANGGYRLDFGLDANDNGTLEVEEVSSSQYLCNNAPAEGLTSLISTTIEPAGANCENGGYRLDVGLDSNLNGTLDAGEVTTSEYLCNIDPSDGLTSLISTVIEMPGDNCSSGGYRLDVGLDSNQNGTLDAEEVTTTEYLCNGDSSDFSYQSYASLISQTGTNDPTVQVLENTLGITIAWVRDSQGIYTGTLDTPIDISKTVIFFSTPTTHTGVRGEILSSSQIRLELQNGINVFADNFENLSFELREYQ